MKNLILIGSVIFMSACGGGASGSNSVATDQSNASSPFVANASTLNTQTPNETVYSTCPANSFQYGTWVNANDSSDRIIINSDCSFTIVKCGIVINMPNNAFPLQSSSFHGWVLNFGNNSPSCVDLNGAYGATDRVINYAVFSQNSFAFKYSNGMSTQTYNKL